MPENELAASKWNPLYEMAPKLYEEQYTQRIKDLNAEGFFVSQRPVRNHEEEMAKILERAPALVKIALMEVTPDNQWWLPFRQHRAQLELQRLQELENERQA